MDRRIPPYTPRTSTDPATFPQTNPLRSNNERDPDLNYDPDLNESTTSDISSSQQSMEDRSTEERDAQTLSQILSVSNSLHHTTSLTTLAILYKRCPCRCC